MKLLIVSLVVIPAFGQIPSTPCISPAAAPAANASTQGQVRRPGPSRNPGQQTAADIAEIARLSDLPAWGQSLADGDYSNGTAYPTAPEFASREHCSRHPRQTRILQYQTFLAGGFRRNTHGSCLSLNCASMVFTLFIGMHRFSACL